MWWRPLCLAAAAQQAVQQPELSAASFIFRHADALPLPAACSASKEQAEGEPPLSMRPKEFSLIWRHNGKRPVTVWMPVAPPSYTAVGAVVRGEPEAPATEDYLCIRWVAPSEQK